MAKYIIVKRFKTNIIGTLNEFYNEKEAADKVCKYMNEKIKDISAFVKFEVKEIK